MIAGRNTDIQIILKDIAAQIKVHAAGQLLDYRLAGFQPYRRAIAADEIKIKAQFLRNDRIMMQPPGCRNCKFIAMFHPASDRVQVVLKLVGIGRFFSWVQRSV